MTADQLIVKRRPEYGWAVYDAVTREKVLPTSANGWYANRKRALAAKADLVLALSEPTP